MFEAAEVLPLQQVAVLNITNGTLFTTYVIGAPRGSRTIGISDAMARLARLGNLVNVVAYYTLRADEMPDPESG